VGSLEGGFSGGRSRWCLVQARMVGGGAWGVKRVRVRVRVRVCERAHAGVLPWLRRGGPCARRVEFSWPGWRDLDVGCVGGGGVIRNQQVNSVLRIGNIKMPTMLRVIKNWSSST
jgi:hypothetical protein